ncbi:unnamed protein product [Moneuplotes crassus]|uniref:Uncharacterized protein n=1 Tax=Euplotes crassus TaxID=5936 RepID=A0AAD1XFZ8_EUPCR|nr:unnamed protein product [Moneuplotes crassus]
MIYWDKTLSDKIEKILQYHGLHTTDRYQLVMKIRDPERTCNLSQIDLKRNFLAQFGDLAYYDFKDANTVHIKYKDPIAAFYCQQFLDGEYITSLKANLIVKWIDHNFNERKLSKRDSKDLRKQAEETQPEKQSLRKFEEEKEDPRDASSMSKIKEENMVKIRQNWIPSSIPVNTMFFNEAVKDPELHEGISLENNNHYPNAFDGSKPHENGTDVQTFQESTIKRCYFELQIEDREFNFKQRIMGTMGCNMKRIEEKCNVDNKDSVKLRFVTKDLTQENDQEDDQDDEQYQEILADIPKNSYGDKSKTKTYLLVESKNYHDYTKAVLNIQELLINVYEDYKRYCEKLSIKPVCGGLIKKIESIKGDRKTVTRVIKS